MKYNYLFNTYEAVTPPKSEQTPYLFEATPKDTSILIDPFGVYSSTPDVFENQEDPDERWNNFILGLTQKQSSKVVDSITVDNIISTGRSFIHKVPYVYGGKSPTKGFDCSGFLTYIFNQNGVNLPEGTSAIGNAGTSVSLSQARPGDIIYSKGTGASGKHVQMISKIENGKIYVLGAQSSKEGITERELNTKQKDIYSVRRIVSTKVQVSNSDPFLTDTNLKAPSKYSNKEKFVENLNEAYKKSLVKYGYNPAYSLALTAWSAMESGYGTAVPASYNYSGIKASSKNSGRYARTKEYDSNGRLYYTNAKFRNFNSLQDFTDYKVSLVFGNRYHLQSFNPTDVYSMIHSAINNGYGTANADYYASSVQKIYNKIKKYA